MVSVGYECSNVFRKKFEVGFDFAFWYVVFIRCYYCVCEEFVSCVSVIWVLCAGKGCFYFFCEFSPVYFMDVSVCSELLLVAKFGFCFVCYEDGKMV